VLQLRASGEAPNRSRLLFNIHWTYGELVLNFFSQYSPVSLKSGPIPHLYIFPHPAKSNSTSPNMTSRSERFQRKPRDKADEIPEQPEELIRFSPEQEAVQAHPRSSFSACC